MRYLIPIILFAHGSLHSLGFAKAYNYANITQITKVISKAKGLLWLLTAVLFVVAAVICLLRKEGWVYFAFPAAILSQILIISVWHDAKFGTILNAIILLVAIASWSTYYFEWKFKTNARLNIEQINTTGSASSNESNSYDKFEINKTENVSPFKPGIIDKSKT